MRFLALFFDPRRSDVYRRRIEGFALAAGIVQPLITLPQIITIYSSQSVTDVSLLTWIGYLVFGLVFLVYGLAFNLKPICRPNHLGHYADHHSYRYITVTLKWLYTDVNPASR